jgi:hypothetical protein
VQTWAPQSACGLLKAVSSALQVAGAFPEQPTWFGVQGLVMQIAFGESLHTSLALQTLIRFHPAPDGSHSRMGHIP